jgi:hypothetical protein
MKIDLPGLQSREPAAGSTASPGPDVVLVTPTAAPEVPELVPAPPELVPAPPVSAPAYDPPRKSRGQRVGQKSRKLHRTSKETPEQKLANRDQQAALIKSLVRDLPAKMGNMAEDGYSRALMAYISTLGDPEQTSRLTQVGVERIRRWAEADGWNEKISALLSVKKEQGQQMFAIELNRLMNLTQAVRLRGLLDEVLTRLMCQEEDLADWLSVKSKDACNVTAKPLLDLAKAIQSVQQATYMALGDQAAERIAAGKKDKDGKDENQQEPSLALFQTLTQMHAKMQPPVLRGAEIPPVRELPPET